MTSSGSIEVWATFIRLCHKAFIVPYDWDTYLNCPQLSSQRSKNLLRCLKVQFLVILLYEAFQVYRGAQEVYDRSKTFPEKIKLLFSIEAYVTLNVNQLLIIRNFHLLPGLLATFSKLFAHIQSKIKIIRFIFESYCQLGYFTQQRWKGK